MFSDYISKDGNPPLYYILLFYWGKIFGSSDISIRFLSYLFTLFGLIFSYLFVIKYFTRRIAIIFLTLCAFTPGVLYFAQEARMYALLYALASIVSVIYCVFIIKIRDNLKIKKKLTVYYFVAGVLICYTHHFGSLLIFSLSSVAIIYSLLLKRLNSTITIFLISFAIGATAVLWLFFQFYYVNFVNHIQDVSWFKNNIIGIILNFSTLLAFNKFGLLFLIFLFIPFLITIPNFIKIIKTYMIILLPVVWLFLTAYFISLKTFLISERYLIVCIPLILLFLSFIFNELYNDKKQYILLYLMGLLTISSYKNYTYKKQNWRDASKYIEGNFNLSKCKVPTRALSEGSFDRTLFISYYLGSNYSYSSNGPQIQDNCNLIYIDGHTNEEAVRKTLVNYNISVPYEILNFNKVYIVIKKGQ
ncbi:glycosyltransferase family 39 protein [Gelidibacter salicanalis]|nr:glycosyltransferase family 39 protein [Gelidibacter salicanalis]